MCPPARCYTAGVCRVGRLLGISTLRARGVFKEGTMPSIDVWGLIVVVGLLAAVIFREEIFALIATLL